MIQNVHIRNFKTLKDLRFPCTRMNLFIGDTSTGKTNILEALSFFSRGVITDDSRIDPRLIRHEKPVDFFPMHDLSEPLMVDIGSMRLGMGFGQGHFTINVSDPKRPKTENPLIAHAGMLTDGRLGPGHLQFPTTIRRYEYLADVQFGHNASKELEPPYGRNLPGLLASNKALRTDINNLLAPTGMRLKVNLTDNAVRMVRTVDEDVEEELPYVSVSDTVKRYLFLYTVLRTHKGYTLLLDEPEQNSFPFYVKHTGEMLGFDKDNQYFITTHNEYLFRSIVEKTPKKELSVFITHTDAERCTQVKRLTGPELGRLLDMDVFFNLDRFVA